jgi:signal transduction histidine kinase/CheY-like chemotaxis protein/ligand-binding sensor domain-containing protein
MKNRRISLIPLLILAALAPAAAQNARLYTPELGLPNSQVNHIYQDRNGYMWLCTEGGLIRFDGMRFETYRHDRENENSLASSSVLDMLEDNRGTNWVGTANGLDIFDSEHISFSRFELPNGQTVPGNPYIGRLLEVPGRSSGNCLYVATGGAGVFAIDCDSRKLLPERREQIYRHVHTDHFHTLFLDGSRRLWLVPGDGIPVILDADSLEPAEGIGWSPDLLRKGDRLRVNELAEDPITGDILLGSTDGLLIARAGSGVIRKVKGKRAATIIAATVIFNSQAAPGEGRSFLVGSENSGLLQFDSETEEVDDPSISSIRQDTGNWKATSSYQDSQGNLWLGLYQTGVLVAPQSMFGFSYIGFSDRGRSGENSAVITSIYESGQTLWVATDGAGLFSRPVGNASKTLAGKSFTRNNSSLTNNSVMAVTGDKRGTIWIGTYLDGLFWLEGGSSPKKFPDGNKIGTERIRTLAYDPVRDLVYAGTYGAGLAIIDARTRRLVGQQVGEEYRWVSALYLDDSGLLWVGTYNGPYCYDPAAGRIIPYNIPTDNDLPLRIYAISGSPDGAKWFGTEEGLFRVDETSRQVSRYTEQDGLANNVIRDILCTGTGEIWVSTASGLSHLSPKTGKISSYHGSDGLQGNEFRAGAAFKSPSGRLYFGGNGGVTYFSPLLVDGSGHQVPQVSLARLTLLDRDVVYNPAVGKENLIDKHISEATQITIPRGVDLFSVGFSVPEYTNPQRIVYDYRLRGYDTDWKTAPALQRSATYTNVPPGRYQLEVKAHFADAPEEYTLRSVDLRVEAPWFRTPVAWLVYLLLLAGLALLFTRLLRERHRREKEKKEAEMKELRLVMGPLRTLREAEKDPTQKDTYNLMYRNCLRINRLVNQLMDIRKIDSGQMPMNFRQTDLVYFVKDIMQSFLPLAESKRILFSIDAAHAEEPVWIDQGNFDKVVYNILSNAFKHTPDGGRIRLGITEPKPNRGELGPGIREFLEVSIFNSGSRIEETYISRIFDRFVQVDPYDANTGSGVGLNLTKLLVELHHGRIGVRNDADGVVFNVLVPVGKEHLTPQELSVTSHHKDLYVKGREISFDSHEDETFASAAPGEGKAARARKTVIVVEDDDDTREYLSSLLRSRYNVVACSSAQEALPRIGETIPDAVLTDLVMPGMSGTGLCAEIRSNPATKHIPVIILTGQDGEQEAQAASDSGADKFLSKPISVELLLSSVSQALSAREAVKDRFGVNLDIDYSGIKMGSTDEKLMRRVTESIQTHLDDPAFDVTALCSDVGISRVHLNRKLKEFGLEPPSVLIRKCRMKQAARLLADSRVNVSEVAYRIGFSSHSYFSSSFREFFGLSPREFVMRMQENPDDEALRKLFE